MPLRFCLHALLSVTTLLGAIACERPTSPPAAIPARLSLVPPLPTHNQVRARARQSPHAFFRLINNEFMDVVCRLSFSSPRVGLHGDAHVEQLAAVGERTGLVDFDESAHGPASLDLLRALVSLRLVGDERDFSASGVDDAVSSFLTGYVSGLRDASPPMSPVLERMLKAASQQEPRGFAARVMERLELLNREQLSGEMLAGWEHYEAMVREKYPEMTEAWFKVKGVAIPVGFGMGSERWGGRYFVRVEGTTESPDDDVLLEAKEIRVTTTPPCVSRTEADVARVVSGLQRFAPYADPCAALIPINADRAQERVPWWVHAWRSDYVAFDADTYLFEESELSGLARDLGRLLAHGHLKGVAADERHALTASLERWVTVSSTLLSDQARSLTQAVLAGHWQFVEAVTTASD